MTVTPELRSGHNTASSLDEDKPDPTLPASEALEHYYQKHEALRGIPGHVIRKAWFTMAHLMLEPGATVLDMGCAPGMTFAMAALHPQINFIGIDQNKKRITEAKKNYCVENLEFRTADMRTMAGMEPESVDAIINSFNLHEIYSNCKFAEQAVINALENHFSLLKQEGLMFIRDFSKPPPEEFVLLEMPDSESKSEALEDLSEPDLLVWYAENARPHGHRGCTGFFLEELPPRFPQTRLFRLSFKWAYEFIMRKDEREVWNSELATEYTFFTPREYRKSLRSLGARVLYTAPQWDDAFIKERFQGRFRLYADDGKPLPIPPTSFVAVAQKMGENKSLHLHERRPSHKQQGRIRITAMRNEITGKLFDVITRDVDQTEVIPYRVTGNNEVNVFIHEGLPRGIANAVPRTGKQIDGKRWSGHMSEAIAVPSEAIHDVENGEPKQVVLFARDYLGLKPAMGCTLEKGPVFYPAPDYIDEQIKTRYLRVSECEGKLEPKKIPEELEGFTTKGQIREVSAQSILNAISVGFIPNSRLESQILKLYEILGLQAETWDECPLSLDSGVPENNLDKKKFMSNLAGDDKRFKNVRGSAGQFRTVQSTFVDEGWVEGGIEGMASRDIEFVIADEQTVNKAVILPLTKHAKTGVVMGGMVPEFLPVPQRHKGNGLTLRAPSVTLPKEVTSVDEAKRFIAAQFDVPVEKVARLGESYFCHIGLTPTRIFPFCVATTGKRGGPMGGPVEYAPMYDIVNMMLTLDDYNENEYIISRYKKVFARELHNSEVSGEWVMNSNKVFEELTQETNAVMSSTQATGLGFSGWSTEKSKEKSEEAERLAATTYTSSPDFVDIHNPMSAEGAVAGQPRYTKKQDHKVINENRRKSDSK